MIFNNNFHEIWISTKPLTMSFVTFSKIHSPIMKHFQEFITQQCFLLLPNKIYSAVFSKNLQKILTNNIYPNGTTLQIYIVNSKCWTAVGESGRVTRVVLVWHARATLVLCSCRSSVPGSRHCKLNAHRYCERSSMLSPFTESLVERSTEAVLHWQSMVAQIGLALKHLFPALYRHSILTANLRPICRTNIDSNGN